MPPETEGTLVDPAPWKDTIVFLDQIDSSDDTYRISTPPSSEELEESIRSCGIINPPVLKEKDLGYSIVSGFRRVEACRKCGLKRIKARVLPAHADDALCVRLSVTENAHQRSLNPMETARIVALLARTYPDAHAISNASAHLGFPLHRSMIEKLSLLNRLPPDVQHAVSKGLIALSVALEFKTLDEEAVMQLVGLFEKLQIGLNQQREMIRQVQEVARRENISEVEVLNDPALRVILTDEKIDRIEKSVTIRWELRKRRFPQITEKEKEFRSCLRKLDLGQGITLNPPRDFEGPSYSLVLQFHTLKTLSHRIGTARRILDDPEFKSFLES